MLALVTLLASGNPDEIKAEFDGIFAVKAIGALLIFSGQPFVTPDGLRAGRH